MLSPGGNAHGANHALGQLARRNELRLQVAKLRAIGQSTMPEQEADFFERRVPGQFVDVVTGRPAHRDRHRGSRWLMWWRRYLRVRLWAWRPLCS